MQPRSISVLHIEDDPIQHQVIVHHLSNMKEFKFSPSHAESEDQAIELFGTRPFQLVILDYQLSQGDGSGCMRRLRQLNHTVPVIAISGVATPEIITGLLELGVDQYIDKRELTGRVLARCVRDLLARGDAR
jgi:CheY-like chemotaxis protein